MSESHLLRGWLLFEQSRYELAASEARLALAQNPDDADAHALLARCLTELGDLQEATREAETAVHLQPDESGNHFVLGLAYFERNRLKEAADCFVESIQWNPDHPEGYCMLALVRYRQKNWKEALELAEQGLALDPEHEDCANIRSLTLLRMGRVDEATDGMEGALSRSPNNGMTHTSMGWTLLEGGQPHKAIEHFREALRLDPDLELARIGIVEALKARNVVYRIGLGFRFWLSRFSEASQWGIIIGMYLAYNLLGSFAQQNPKWEPFVTPILWAYFAFVLLTWFDDPIFNLLLRLSPVGRHALKREQIIAANWVGVFGLTGVALLITSVVIKEPLRWPICAMAALVFIVLGLSVSRIYDCAKGWPRKCMTAYTLILALLGLPHIIRCAIFLANGAVLQRENPILFELSQQTVIPFGVAAFLMVFVSNWLAVREPKH